jgi:DNA repair exonuclease SbcCD ATPase subunit
MDSEKPPPEDLDVRLYWPGEERRPTERPARPKSPTRARPQRAEGADAEMVRPQIEATAAIPAGDPVGATLGSIAMRLESLANTTALLRTVVADRLADYSDQVARAQSISARDLEDYRRGHERMLGDIEASLREGENSIQRLERSTSDALTRLEEATRQLGGRLETVHDRLENVSRLEDATRQLDNRLEAVHDRLENVSRLEDATRQLDNRLEAVHDRLENVPRLDETTRKLESTLQAIQERLEERSAAEQQPAATDISQILDVLLELRSELDTKSDDQAEVLVETVTTALARIESAMPKAQGEAMARLLELVGELHTRRDALNTPDAEGEGAVASSIAIERLDKSAESIARLEDAVSRLGEAQAEDLERLMDTIESLGAPEGSFVAARINHFSRQLDALDKKLDVLRRRIALRARSDQSLDAETVERLAEAVAALLSPEAQAEPPTEQTRRRPKRG